MKRIKQLLICVGMIGLFSFSACNSKTIETGKNDASIIGRHNLELSSPIMTPEVLWSFGRISDVRISPDGEKVLYGTTYYSIPEDKGNRELFVMNLDGTEKRQITRTAFSEHNAVWKPDGKKIGFLSSESGSMQIWEMDIDGKQRTQISNVKDGISGFMYAPDGKRILFSADVEKENKFEYLFEGLDKSSGRIMDDLMYRHWDHWVDFYSHIFIADYDGNSLSNVIDLLEGEPFETPVAPFGGLEQVAFSPDGQKIAYTCRKLTGKAYASSTNADIYEYDIATKKTVNLTEGMLGYDWNPVYSPDGTMLAWESMERDGYEADKLRLFILDRTTGTKKDYSKNFDQNSTSLAFTPDSKSIYLISDYHATEEIYRLDIQKEEFTRITNGIYDYTSFAFARDKIIATKHSMSKPTEIYTVNPVTGEDYEISFENKHLLDQLTFGKITKRWVKTTDNKEMLVWVILPPNFDENKQYPTLLYCQGGPQSTVSQSWSYRWNFQMMAANDYIIVAPNRRGLPGFGQEWLEQISGDYGGQNMKDYLAAIDEVKVEPWVDENRLGAVGASYGGFSVYWLAGHHENRFKAFIAHDGMFNFEAQYLETEEMFFVDWDLGGPFWDKNNTIAQRSYSNSPHRFVQNWNTPILVIHSELDYRIVASQGMSAFNAAILNGVPAEYLYFPNENHWVLHPQNGILWQRTFFDWLDKWLK
ncbi:MAG: S9 family peptidase [Bacteroidales bacterium]|nr:S9 family peptidase [Bacteroidales bacterium]